MSHQIVTAYDLADYCGSRDYAQLAELAKQQSIICIVDYKVGEEHTIREIGRTAFMAKGDQELWHISARGCSFLTAFDQQGFINLCDHLNVEFMAPAK